MPDLLNGISRGSGTVTSVLNTLQGGITAKPLANNVPGDEVDPGGFGDGIFCNSAAILAGRIHSVLTDVYATAQPNGTLTPTWTVRDTTRQAGNNSERSGLHACLTTAGPGMVHAFRNPADGTTRVLRWDEATQTITQFDQTSGSEFSANNPIYSSYVVGARLFLFGNNDLCQVVDLETGAFTIISAPGVGNYTRMIAEINGNIYSFARGGGGGIYFAFYVFLGGAWVEAIVDPTLTNAAAPPTGAGMACWARNGKLYGLGCYNADNGLSMFEYDPFSSTWTDVTTTVLDALLRDDGGLQAATSNARNWDFGFYVDVDTGGSPRYMLQVFPNLSDQNPGCILFEHTDSGVSLVADTAINGGSNCKTLAQSNVAPYSFDDVTGKLWSVQWALPQSDPQGMLLTFRFGGDPGNADKVIRIYYSAPAGAPQERAGELVAPGGGLGQGGATLVDEGGGAYRIDGWDANGSDNLTVIHRTLVEGIPNGQPTEWTAKITEA